MNEKKKTMGNLDGVGGGEERTGMEIGIAIKGRERERKLKLNIHHERYSQLLN